MQMNI